MHCRTKRALIFAGVCICSAGISLGTGISTASAQNAVPLPTVLPETPLLQGTIAGDGETAYLVQNPEPILGSDVLSVLFSPDSRFILASRAVRTAIPESLLGKPDMAPGELTISLWRSRTRRTGVIYRRVLQPGQSARNFWFKGWMGTTERALASVLIHTRNLENPAEKPTYQYLMLSIDAAAGTVREVILPPKTNGFAKLSPTLPLAALLGADGSCEDRIRFLRADGTISEALPLPGHIYFTRWSEDGRMLRGLSHRKDAREGDEPDWYAADPVAMTVAKIPTPPKTRNGKTDYGGDDLVQASLPLKLTARPIGETGRTEVWLEDQANPKAALRLTPDGLPVGILPDLSSVVYRASGGLFIAPLLAVRKETLPTENKTSQSK